MLAEERFDIEVFSADRERWIEPERAARMLAKAIVS